MVNLSVVGTRGTSLRLPMVPGSGGTTPPERGYHPPPAIRARLDLVNEHEADRIDQEQPCKAAEGVDRDRRVIPASALFRTIHESQRPVAVPHRKEHGHPN